MKRGEKKVVKGTSSAVVLSILIHAALFLLAGMLVVFSVVKVKEPEFEAPKAVERPKMKLRKPKVKPQKASKPKSTTRIVTRKNLVSMPDIQLPEMSGMGDGLGDGVGAGFNMMPDLGELTTFGANKSIGNDLEGVYYDLKFSRSGLYNPMGDAEWRDIFYRFFSDDWNPRHFSRFYRSPNKLYTTCLLFPPTLSAMAPVAFGMSDEKASGGHWIVHYKGKLVHKEDITFRFWVSVDDSLAIRVDGEVVVAASLIGVNTGQRWREADMYRSKWESSSIDTASHIIASSMCTVGDWITLEAGVPKDMEVVATDNISRNASYIVMVEVKGVEYPKNRYGGPLLPIFKTAELTHDHLDLIYQFLADGEVDCINGPIFRDY